MELYDFSADQISQRARRILSAPLDDITPSAYRNPQQTKQMRKEVHKAIELVLQCGRLFDNRVPTRTIARNLEEMAYTYRRSGQSRQHEIAGHLYSLAQQLYMSLRPRKT